MTSWRPRRLGDNGKNEAFMGGIYGGKLQIVRD